MAQTIDFTLMDEASLDAALARYSGDRTVYPVLMHLWSTYRAETTDDMLASLRIHRTRLKRALRLLMTDRVVEQHGDGMYALADGGETRAWVSRLLRRAIYKRRIRNLR